MTLSAALVQRYTTEMDVDWHHAFVVRHPAAGSEYLIDSNVEFTGLVDGAPQVFAPVPTQIVPPRQDDNGRQDLQIVWSGIHARALRFLNAAVTQAEHAIELRWSVFIDGDPNPQIDPWIELSMTNIDVSRETVAAVATRADIFNRPFPTALYTVERYPGLRRR